jgi:hypothetical protein
MCSRNPFLRNSFRNRTGRIRLLLSVWALSLATLLLACSGAQTSMQKKSRNGAFSTYVFGTASFAVSDRGFIAAGADFNGDGRADLVALNSQNNSVSILLGQKDGTLSDSGASYAVGIRPQGVAIADFNGDGKPDLALLNLVCPPNTNSCPAGSVSILLGKGDGTFQAHLDFATGPAPVAIAAGDFNGDGRPDLAVTNHVNPIDSNSPGTFSILLGNGDGTFQTHIDHAAGSGVGTLVAADFNKDGKLDVVISNTPTATNSAVLLMLGNGDGTFQGPTVLSISGAPVAFATGDFNRDGNADLAVTTSTSAVSVLLGNGNGTFQAHADYPVASSPGSIIATDLDKDGSLDLLVGATGNFQEGFISILLGHGDGTFQSHADYVEGSSVPVAVNDFNGDGKNDVALVQGNLAQIVLGKGDGTFIQPAPYDVGGSPLAVGIADFNNDGSPDLVVTSCPQQCQNGNLSVFLGNGDGTFQAHRDSPIGASPSFVLATGDFNGDGKQDIASTDTQAAEVTVLLGNGDGSFRAPVNYSVGNAPEGIIVGDFNHDGALDLAVANQFDNTISILIGNGDGTFKAQATYQTGPAPFGLTMGDFNGDAKLDIAVANSGTPVQGPSLISVLLGNGDGTFQSHQDVQIMGPTSRTLTTGDFNADGKLDLAVAANLDSELGKAVILLGNGDGTFQFSKDNVYGTGFFANGIASGDFNGDGVADVALPSLVTNTLALLKSDGRGSMQYQGFYAAGVQPDAIAMADLNGDNIADVVVANFVSGTVSVLVSQ